MSLLINNLTPINQMSLLINNLTPINQMSLLINNLTPINQMSLLINNLTPINQMSLLINNLTPINQMSLLINNLTPINHFRGPGPRSKPFMSHAGPEAFDHWNKHIIHSLKTAFPSVRIADRHEISQIELVREVLNVMIAVPSVNFMLDLVSNLMTLIQFPIRARICLQLFLTNITAV